MKKYLSTESYLQTLYLFTYILVTIYNTAHIGWDNAKQWDVGQGQIVFDEPGHGKHYDFLVFTYFNAYYVDLATNRVFTEDGTTNITFQDFIDMKAWLANTTEDAAYQTEVLLRNYKSVVSDGVHADSADIKAAVKRRVLDVLEKLDQDEQNENKTNK